MEKCHHCKFYVQHFLGKPTCSRISNVSLVSKKNVPFKVPVAFKICKGYFFELDEMKLATERAELEKEFFYFD